jgi:hypothetical protein
VDFAIGDHCCALVHSSEREHSRVSQSPLPDLVAGNKQHVVQATTNDRGRGRKQLKVIVQLIVPSTNRAASGYVYRRRSSMSAKRGTGVRERADPVRVGAVWP